MVAGIPVDKCARALSSHGNFRHAARSRRRVRTCVDSSRTVAVPPGRRSRRSRAVYGRGLTLTCGAPALGRRAFLAADRLRHRAIVGSTLRRLFRRSRLLLLTGLMPRPLLLHDAWLLYLRRRLW